MDIGVDYKNGSDPNEIYICCMFCERDGRTFEDFKLGVNLTSGKFHCYRCGATQRHNTLPFLDGYEEDTTDYSLLDLMGDLDKKKERKNDQIFDLDEISYPLTSKTPIAWRYMTGERGFTPSQIDFYQLRVGKSFQTTNVEGVSYQSTKWQGRVIFPFFEDKLAKYLVGRTYVGDKNKYLNCKNTKSYIFNLDNVTNRTAILCEGIISAVAAENHSTMSGISLLGKYATETQLMKIRSKVDRVIICLDGDVDKTPTMGDMWDVKKTKPTDRLKNQLRDFNFSVSEMSLPDGKDPDECTQEEFLKYLKNSKEVS